MEITPYPHPNPNIDFDIPDQISSTRPTTEAKMTTAIPKEMEFYREKHIEYIKSLDKVS